MARKYSFSAEQMAYALEAGGSRRADGRGLPRVRRKPTDGPRARDGWVLRVVSVFDART